MAYVRAGVAAVTGIPEQRIVETTSTGSDVLTDQRNVRTKTTSTCVLVLANGAPAGGTRIWGHVLVLANSQRLARIQSRQPGLSIREMQATVFWKQCFGAW